MGVRTFDPVRVGFLTDVPGFPKFTVYDPNGNPIAGNSNAGHWYPKPGAVSREDLEALLAYLGTL